LSWGGFGLNAQRNKISPLLQLMNKEKSLSPAFSLWEDVEGGAAPAFNDTGFISPKQVPLITEGEMVGSLISARSAKEFGVETTGASGEESPESIAVKAGGLATEDILSTLDTGLLIGNLWYLNYSDRSSCRITGMTRFATFWVENGEIVAPVNVMRFDEPVYRILGSNLEDLSTEREFLLSASSYYQRSTGSAHLPGALIRDFRFTL
jgi:predicted Zn-dependent protease